MRLAKFITAVAACSLAVSPALAESAASKLSLSSSESVRTSTVADESNEARGGFIIPLVAIVAIILGVLVAVDGDDDPDSP